MSFQTNCYVVATGAGRGVRGGRPRSGRRRAPRARCSPSTGSPRSPCCSPTATSTTPSASRRSATATTCPAWIHPARPGHAGRPAEGPVAATRPRSSAAGWRLREPREVRRARRRRRAGPRRAARCASTTPPATPAGSVMFTAPTEEGVEVILAGDTLFAGSIGRTDLPGGDHAQMLASLRDKMLTRARRPPWCCPATGRRRPSAGSGRPTRSCGTSAPGAGRAAVTADCDAARHVRRAQGRAGVLPAGLGRRSRTCATRCSPRPTAPATASSSCRSSRTPALYARGVGESTDVVSARRCTPSPTAATARSRCAPRAPRAWSAR